MEIYTSDSSESCDQHTLNFSHESLTISKAENKISNITKNPVDCEEIHTIYLNNNALSTVPMSLLKFQNLRILDISSNNLKTIPLELILNLPLTTLIAKNCNFPNEALPKSFCRKNGESKLKELNLSANQLTHFPEQVLEIKSLKYLYLSGNHIQSISRDISKLKK
jgi:Leucine-rich repeat (LRR) protein